MREFKDISDDAHYTISLYGFCGALDLAIDCQCYQRFGAGHFDSSPVGRISNEIQLKLDEEARD